MIADVTDDEPRAEELSPRARPPARTRSSTVCRRSPPAAHGTRWSISRTARSTSRSCAISSRPAQRRAAHRADRRDRARADRPVGGGAARGHARARNAGFYRPLTKPVKVAELTRALEDLRVEPDAPGTSDAPIS